MAKKTAGNLFVSGVSFTNSICSRKAIIVAPGREQNLGTSRCYLLLGHKSAIYFLRDISLSMRHFVRARFTIIEEHMRTNALFSVCGRRTELKSTGRAFHVHRSSTTKIGFNLKIIFKSQLLDPHAISETKIE